MGYSIGEAAKKVNMTTHTLRYYEKEGLISIKRKENGLREFSESDIELLKVINCLKETNMPIADIKKYISLCDGGAKTNDARKEIFVMQKQHIEKEIERLTEFLNLSKFKIWYYENIDKLGDESDPNNCDKMREMYKNISDD